MESVHTTGSRNTTVRLLIVSPLPALTLYLAGAIIFTIIALFSILSYWGYRARIPLASLLLQVVMDVSKHHMSVYVVAFTALVLQAALSVYVFALYLHILSAYSETLDGMCSRVSPCKLNHFNPSANSY